MATTLDSLKHMKLYKKKFYLPINKSNKKKGSAILLLTPNYESSVKLMNNPLAINLSNSFQSYYIEKDITYTINNECKLQIDHTDNITMINEQASVFTEVTDVKNYDMNNDIINEFYCKMGNKAIFFNEMYDDNVYMEVAGNNTKYKRLLYNDRIRNNKTVFNLYKKVKEDNPWITKTFINYNRYKQSNLFIDLYYYNQTYLGNNNFTINKSIDMYFEFVRRFINDKRIDNAGYTRKTVFIPINGWEYNKDKYRLYNYLKVLNPISVFYKKIRLRAMDLDVFKGTDFVFFGNNGYFKVNIEEIIKAPDYLKFIKFVKALEDNEPIDDNDEVDNSADAITTSIIDKIEQTKGIQIHNITGVDTTGKETEKLKAELVTKVSKAAEGSADEDETLDKLEDADIKRLLDDLESQSEDGIKLSPTRVNRINRAQDELMNKKMNNKSIKEIINTSNKPKELPETALPIKTINEEWKHLKAVNFENDYDVNADIVRCLNSLSDVNKDFPVSILNIDTEDTSTTEDSIITYTVKCESYEGKRFSLKFDIPKFRDGRFMRLRGNEKIFSGEMPLLPISKTDEDTVQIATYYNKIFIRRYYTSSGKSNPTTDRLIKALGKYDGKELMITLGDNSKISNSYELPIDYMDLSNKYSKVEYYSNYNKSRVTIYFNQNEIRKLPKVNLSKGLPVAVIERTGDIMYYNGNLNDTFSGYLVKTLFEVESFSSVYNATKPGKKYTYSRASILNTDIPTIVIMAHKLGLTKSLELAGISYDISDKKEKDQEVFDSIKFADGYLNYKMSYNSMMMMNGLKDCNTEDYNIASINSKSTWVDMLDNFGGRVKSDGLDNFKDLMFDPVTIDVCRDYKLPDNYFEALVYSNNLLADNKYTKHIDISTNRFRTNEVIAAQFYRILSNAYRDYALQNRHGRTSVMYIKQSAVIDLILASNTTSDLSVFQPLYEIEAKNAVSFKGVTGMNSDRAYSMDKRGYDKSMLNTIAQSTGFAATVGINRQMTINPSITGGRGYFKQTTTDDVNITNTLSMTEALSPFCVSSDDPFRNAMTFVQTSKHTTPIENGSPLLVTTGADLAMPYLSSDMFCHKSKASGVVKELIQDKYLLVEYNTGETEYVNLLERTMKNSDGGFYISLKFKTDLKVGDKVKKDTILGYDEKSFSKKIGDHSQLAYNLGCIAKVAIMNSEDGFEDSGVVGEWLSDAMASDIVLAKPVNLPSSTNVLFLAKVGQQVSEGEPILIFQNAYDEEDANLLLKSLNNEDGDVSEIGRNTVKSKVTGVISDIKIFRTVELDELSESLKKIVVTKEREIKKLKSIADKSKNDTVSLFDPIDKLSANGKLKDVDGVRIEIYMKYHDKLSVGDKLVVNNANKVVIMDTYTDTNAPYTDFRPNEAIDVISSCSAIDGRMITSNFKLGCLYKIMIELSRKVKETMGVKWKTIHDMNKDV